MPQLLKGEQKVWPHDSPPLEFFLWGALKRRICSSDLPNDMKIINKKIQEAILELKDPHSIRKSERRMNYHFREI